MGDYLPIVLLLLIAGGLAAAILGFSHLVGPRNPNPTQLSSHRSQALDSRTGRLTFSVHLYLVAVLFLVFSIEVVFLVPWAAAFQNLLTEGAFIVGGVIVSIGILVLGLAYFWRNKGLEWD